MRKSLLRGTLLILCAALLLCGGVCALIFDLQLSEEKTANLERLTQVMAQQFDPALDNDLQADRFGQAAPGVRVTILAPDGTVTGDSQADHTTMENHADREEIVLAGTTRRAVTIRHSVTLGQQQMYTALRTPDGCYIRLSLDYAGVSANLLTFLPAVLAAAAMAILFSYSFAATLSAGITGPIVAMNASLTRVKAGRTMLNPESYPYEELRAMAAKINALAADVSQHIAALQEERDKSQLILDNMSEGLILLDREENILLINHSARAFLNAPSQLSGGRADALSRDEAFLAALRRACREECPALLDLEQGGRVLEVQLFPLRHRQEELDGGLLITLTDVTARRSAVRTRRDFFSNASHELKTPITAIQGCAELLCSDIPLTQEQRTELLGSIRRETGRMGSLINDIIMINRLESGDLSGEREPVDLETVVRDGCREITPFAQSQGLTLQIRTQSARLMANPKDLRELVGNLLTNAVKYNRPGGRIDVTLQTLPGRAQLTVRNDGDPIPPEHHSRIFERFYRVDKGRSRTAGGTGLGLSIVKHVVDDLGGTIALTSTPEQGTAFTITLPRLPGA